MTPKRRATIIIISVFLGTTVSAGMLYLKRGGLDKDEFFILGTNLFFSLFIIFAIGYFLIWRKKN